MNSSSVLGRIYAQLRNGDWLNRNRVLAYLRIALFFQALAFIYVVLATHHLMPGKQDPSSTDFVSFYTAGHLAQIGAPELAYDPVIHQHVEEAFMEKGSGYFAFYYPPMYLFICRLLSCFPYMVAFCLFIGTTGLFYLAALRPVLPGYAFPLAAIASPSFILAVGSGQNSFLTCGLFGFGLLLFAKRPLVAGMLFGAVCYKPHFGLILPLALLCAREWRVILGAVISVAFLVSLSILTFGVKTWSAFEALQGKSFATFANGWVDHSQQATVFASMRLLGASIPLASTIHASIAAIVIAATANVWMRTKDLASRAMVLTIGATLVPPVFLNYDLLLAGVGMAWLVNSAEKTGYRPWEKMTLLLAYVVADFSRFSGSMLHLSLSPWVMLSLFTLVYQRARLMWRCEISAPIPRLQTI